MTSYNLCCFFFYVSGFEFSVDNLTDKTEADGMGQMQETELSEDMMAFAFAMGEQAVPNFCIRYLFLKKMPVKQFRNFTHNNRDFICNNVVAERTPWNRICIQESLKDAYEKCFGQVLRDYNTVQKCKDKKKENYLAEIENYGNKEKIFYEDIVHIGKNTDTPVVDQNGILTEDVKAAIKVLDDQYAKTFQERNPNLYLFN